MSAVAEYLKLLIKYQPQPIRSEQAYKRALAQLEELMVPYPGAASSRMIEMLSTLIEQYESHDNPTPHVPASVMLAHLLESRKIKPAVLAKATGISPATISSALSRQRGISKANALKLAKFFEVSPIVFLVETPEHIGEFQTA